MRRGLPIQRRCSPLRSAIRIWFLLALILLGAIWFHGFPSIEVPDKPHPPSDPIKDSPGMQTETPSNAPNETPELHSESKEAVQTKEMFPRHLKASEKVVAFYYPWYGNPNNNGDWIHWNHKILVDNGATYEPPDSIGANFYPELGPYSSTDPEIVEKHMRYLTDSGVGIICISWWGQANSDDQLKHVSGFTDSAVELLLEKAALYNIKICFHHEPYEGRNALHVRRDVEYVVKKYGEHPAFFRWKEQNDRPLFFVYDYYLTKAEEWATILSPDGEHTIRNTDFDSVMVALFVNNNDKNLISHGNFDGGYTYFATDGFTQGSTTANWKSIADWLRGLKKVFIPSVGPGYDDTRIRPWNAQNKRDRKEGKYYDEMWQHAVDVDPPVPIYYSPVRHSPPGCPALPFDLHV
eukprot:TRINITY_DN5335_c0_g1_i1.p1 TRINITY_DN5335_c0_g1~~TRINITY_DN5335_c0_g1_i1.p1  ORF type:complete len:408 (+),score=38.50 TRINITY_DN5335_c0_g1_i1:134-1357(+)